MVLTIKEPLGEDNISKKTTNFVGMQRIKENQSKCYDETQFGPLNRGDTK